MLLKNYRLLIFLFALTLRLFYLLQIAHSPLLEVLLIDSDTYDRFAHLILDNAFGGEVVYSMNILYPYFLAGIYRLFANSFLLVAIIQALFDSVTCVMIGMIADNLLDRRAAFISGIMAAVYGPFIFYSATLLTPTLINFFLVYMLLLLTLDKGRPRPLLVMLSGMALGLAILGRANSILVIPISLLLFRQTAGGWRAALRPWAVFAVAALLLPSLATVRNYLIAGHFVPVSVNYGAFYSGHNEHSTGLYTKPEFVDNGRYESEVLGTQNAVAELLGKPVSLAETSQYLLGEGLRHVVEHPVAEARLALRKFYFFWNTTESPTNLNFYFAQDFSSLLRWLPFSFGVIASLGIVGIFLLWSEGRRHPFLLLFIAVYLFTCLAFYVSAEYRLPVVPVMMVFAGYGVLHFWSVGREMTIRIRSGGSRKAPVSISNQWSGRQRRFFPLLVFAVALLFCSYRTDFLRLQSQKTFDYLNFGNLYREHQQAEKAREMYSAALRIDPGFAPAYSALGELEAQAGNFSRAQDLYRIAAQIESRNGQPAGDAEAAMPLRLVSEGLDFYRRGNYLQALELFRQALADTTRPLTAAFRWGVKCNMAVCYSRLARHDQAEMLLGEVLSENPGHARALINLGWIYQQQGRPADALRAFRAGLEIEPQNAAVVDRILRLQNESAKTE